jgi:hypothetical protein
VLLRRRHSGRILMSAEVCGANRYVLVLATTIATIDGQMG